MGPRQPPTPPHAASSSEGPSWPFLGVMVLTVLVIQYILAGEGKEGRGDPSLHLGSPQTVF